MRLECIRQNWAYDSTRLARLDSAWQALGAGLLPAQKLAADWLVLIFLLPVHVPRYGTVLPGTLGKTGKVVPFTQKSFSELLRTDVRLKTRHGKRKAGRGKVVTWSETLSETLSRKLHRRHSPIAFFASGPAVIGSHENLSFE